MKNHLKQFLKTALWLLSAVLFALTGYYLAKSNNGSVSEASFQEERLSPQCKVESVYHYTYCAHDIRADADARSLIGLSKAELAKALDNGKVTKFTADYALIEYTFMQYCPEHFILILENNTLCVKRSKAGSAELETIKTIGIQKDSLPKSYIDRLSSGIVFGSKHDLDKFLYELK